MDVRDVSRYRPVMCWKRFCGFSTQVRNGTCCIQVNAILPGWIDTELTRKAREQVLGLYERVLARTPAQRWGNADDFAGIAVFLAAPASNFVTGRAIPIDGGYSIMG